MSIFILRSWKICAEVGTYHCCYRVCWRVIHTRKLANCVTKLAKNRILVQTYKKILLASSTDGPYHFGCTIIAVQHCHPAKYRNTSREHLSDHAAYINPHTCPNSLFPPPPPHKQAQLVPIPFSPPPPPHTHKSTPDLTTHPRFFFLWLDSDNHWKKCWEARSILVFVLAAWTLLQLLILLYPTNNVERCNKGFDIMTSINIVRKWEGTKFSYCH